MDSNDIKFQNQNYLDKENEEHIQQHTNKMRKQLKLSPININNNNNDNKPKVNDKLFIDKNNNKSLKFVVSGKFSVKQENIKKELKNHGANIIDSLNDNPYCVIVRNKNTKSNQVIRNAKNKGIPIITINWSNNCIEKNQLIDIDPYIIHGKNVKNVKKTRKRMQPSSDDDNFSDIDSERIKDNEPLKKKQKPNPTKIDINDDELSAEGYERKYKFNRKTIWISLDSTYILSASMSSEEIEKKYPIIFGKTWHDTVTEMNDFTRSHGGHQRVPALLIQHEKCSN